MDIYSRDFAEWLLTIFNCQFPTYAEDRSIYIAKNQYGHFSSINLTYTLTKEGNIVDFGNIGIDMNENEIVEIFQKFLLDVRDNKIAEIIG